MTPDAFRQAQASLRLTDAEMAEAIGRSADMVRRYKARGSRARAVPADVEAVVLSMLKAEEAQGE